MEITKSKLLSLLVAAICIAAASYCAGANGLWNALKGVAISLVLIWFAEPLGDYTGFVGAHYISRPTPAIFIEIVGWLLLLGLLAFSFLSPVAPN